MTTSRASRVAPRPLDDFLTRQALADVRAGKTHIAARDKRVIGYFALKASTVSPPATIEHVSGQGPLDIPVILLERLAVDAGEQGKGIGEAMLVQALSRCLQASSTMFSGRYSSTTATPARAASSRSTGSHRRPLVPAISWSARRTSARA